MDFSYDDEQNALREAARALLSRAYGDSEQRRAVVATEPGFDEKTWSRLAEMGLLGLPFAEADGGMGAGPVEVSIVAEEIGRVLAPEPFVEAVVLAGGLVADLGSGAQRAQVLGALAEGRLLPAFAHAEIGTRWEPVARSVTARRADDGAGGAWTLTGVKEPVPNGARADLLVVSALVSSGGAPGASRLFLVQGDAAGLTRTGHRNHDGTRSAKVTFAGTPAEPLGEGTADQAAAVERAQARARVAYGHEALGAMETALTTTAEHLRTRRQFGVPLSRFQALTHRAADMYVSLELARSTALWATLVVDADGDVVAAADRARLQVSRAGRHIGEEAIQLHGGIGVTAEYSVGHCTSRLVAIDHLLGDGDWALSRLAASVDSYPAVDPLG
ncbi:acyl-CoA dehydrogenase family protein [Modestobacter sp. SYSU DS0875]